ncbi:MAG: sugar phosphate isomerase/epimerase [Deltaproteobacteria bacterium]|nr:sugar phosphate isomerase/epimerase [Deltaproteobacteria bacterium]
MLIFASSACVRHQRIGDSVRELAAAGFRHIELTAGTKPYESLEDELLALRDELGLTYLVHNYFPPPAEPFVLNLASPDDEIWQRSIDLCRTAIALAQRLGQTRYSVHAGHLLDLRLGELGKPVADRAVAQRPAAVERFARAYQGLQSEFPDVAIHVENNVLSETNWRTFRTDPFLVTDHAGYLELKSACPDLLLLLDLAHLQVSCQSLSLPFDEEADKLLAQTDYLHVSDNDGRADSNRGLLSERSAIATALAGKLADQHVVCEIYSGLTDLTTTMKILSSLAQSRKGVEG